VRNVSPRRPRLRPTSPGVASTAGDHSRARPAARPGRRAAPGVPALQHRPEDGELPHPSGKLRRGLSPCAHRPVGQGDVVAEGEREAVHRQHDRQYHGRRHQGRGRTRAPGQRREQAPVDRPRGRCQHGGPGYRHEAGRHGDGREGDQPRRRRDGDEALPDRARMGPWSMRRGGHPRPPTPARQGKPRGHLRPLLATGRGPPRSVRRGTLGVGGAWVLPGEPPFVPNGCARPRRSPPHSSPVDRYSRLDHLLSRRTHHAGPCSRPRRWPPTASPGCDPLRPAPLPGSERRGGCVSPVDRRQSYAPPEPPVYGYFSPSPASRAR
jgi:hypothetical protein